MDGLTPELSSIYDRELRRRKLNEALLQQAVTPEQTQIVSGRAVPYSPIQGLTKIAQALLARKGIQSSDEAMQDVSRRQMEGQQQAMQDVMQQMKGSPQTGGPLRGVSEYQPVQPAVAPDLEGAAMRAVTDPYLANNKGAQSVLSAMLRAKGYGDQERSGYNIYKTDEKGNVWKLPGRGDAAPTPIMINGQPFQETKWNEDKAAALEKAKKYGSVMGQSLAESEIQLPAVESSADQTLDYIDALTSHPGMKDVIGWPDNPVGLKGYMWGTPAADFKSRFEQITGRTFMEIFPTLKGGGQITEIEGQKGQDSINRMKAATSEKEFLLAAQDLKNEINRLRNVVRERAGKSTGNEPEKKVKARRKVGDKVIVQYSDGTYGEE